MSIHRTSRSGLFLMELILIILFFAITSGVCVNLFAKAHVLSAASTDLNHAVLQCETAAETYKHLDGDLGQVASSLGGEQQGEMLVLYFDQEWNQVTDRETAVYRLTLVQTQEENGLTGAVVSAAKGEKELYQLTVKKFI